MTTIECAPGRRSRRSELTLAVVIASLAVMLTAGNGSAASTTPYGVNLLKNPGAEAGLSSWGTQGAFEVVAYGSPGGFPTLAEGHRIKGGHEFFSGGPVSGSCNYAFQTVKVRDRGASIDSGHVEVDLSARIATFGHDSDRAEVVVDFGGTDGFLILGSSSGISALRTNGRFVRESLQVVMPWHARSVNVTLGVDHQQGPYCDGYFDRLSLTIKHI